MQIDVRILFLAAKIIKAEKGSRIEEIEHVRRNFIQSFGQQRASKAFENFNQLKDKLSTEQAARDLRQYTSYDSRLNVMRFLFETAYVDREISHNELQELLNISEALGIFRQHFDHIYSAYVSGSYSGNYGEQYVATQSDYELLEVEEGASIEIIKKSYRVLAKKYHPDATSNYNEDEKKLASDKFAEISQAYDRLRNTHKF